KHFLQLLISLKTLLILPSRFFRSDAVSARGHYRDRTHVGKPFLLFFWIFLSIARFLYAFSIFDQTTL
ncbi:hypothetical protein OAP63_08960, partial [Vibrio sp.]|nr:hypothetical protein [Vibrio sp.]